MITLIQGHDAHLYPQLIYQMYAVRAKVFSGRLGWEVNVQDGLERDRFDDLDPLYVLYLDEMERVLGTFRLLQTTGPNMLSEVFTACLPQGLLVRSPIVWESTRFCVDTELARERGSTGLSEVTGALLSSLIEVGVYAGLSHIVTVIDVRMERILRRAGCPIERLGEPVAIGNVPTLAILMECSEDWITSIQRTNGLSRPCVDTKQMQAISAAA